MAYGGLELSDRTTNLYSKEAVGDEELSVPMKNETPIKVPPCLDCRYTFEDSLSAALDQLAVDSNFRAIEPDSILG